MLKYMWVIPDGFSCVTTMTLTSSAMATKLNMFRQNTKKTWYFQISSHKRHFQVPENYNYNNSLF